MIKKKHILAWSLMIICGSTASPQLEVLPETCLTNNIENKVDSNQKKRIIDLVRSVKVYGCRSFDERMGFAPKMDTLMTITTFNEKLQLFTAGSPELKLYLFNNILLENDSIGFELLRNFITDTSPITSFCSCTVDETDLNLFLVNYYSLFIELKYQLGAGGTMGGRTVYYNQQHKPVPDKKKWKIKLYELKELVRSKVNISKLKQYYPRINKELLN